LEDKLLLTEFQITTNESRQEEPVIYWDRILWQDNRNGNYDIYMCILSESEGKGAAMDFPALLIPE
jgi:beta propeller repeat protein